MDVLKMGFFLPESLIQSHRMNKQPESLFNLIEWGFSNLPK